MQIITWIGQMAFLMCILFLSAVQDVVWADRILVFWIWVAAAGWVTTYAIDDTHAQVYRKYHSSPHIPQSVEIAVCIAVIVVLVGMGHQITAGAAIISTMAGYAVKTEKPKGSK